LLEQYHCSFKMFLILLEQYDCSYKMNKYGNRAYSQVRLSQMGGRLNSN
jgi:hypothetical protein